MSNSRQRHFRPIPVRTSRSIQESSGSALPNTWPMASERKISRCWVSLRKIEARWLKLSTRSFRYGSAVPITMGLKMSLSASSSRQSHTSASGFQRLRPAPLSKNLLRSLKMCSFKAARFLACAGFWTMSRGGEYTPRSKSPYHSRPAYRLLDILFLFRRQRVYRLDSVSCGRYRCHDKA